MNSFELDALQPIDEYDMSEEGKLVRSLFVAALKSMLDQGYENNPGMGRGIFVTGCDGVQYMLLSEGDEIKVNTIDPENPPHPDGTLFTFDKNQSELH